MHVADTIEKYRQRILNKPGVTAASDSLKNLWRQMFVLRQKVLSLQVNPRLSAIPGIAAE